MNTPTKAWLYLCAIIIYTAAVWYHGNYTSDNAWKFKEAKQHKAAADAVAKLSEEYRNKEQANATEWAARETQYINQAGADERDYRDAVARLRAGDGVRVKREFTCGVPSATAATSGGNDQAQGGLSTEVAEDVIGVGREADEVARQLALCQDYAQLCYEMHKEKAP